MKKTDRIPDYPDYEVHAFYNSKSNQFLTLNFRKGLKVIIFAGINVREKRFWTFRENSFARMPIFRTIIRNNL